MSNDVNRIDIREFRESGFLQELNRKFLHPMGMALEVIIDDEDGSESLGGIWDYREDDEGVYYDIEHSDEETIKSFTKKAKFVEEHYNKVTQKRFKKLGFIVEPIEDVSI